MPIDIDGWIEFSPYTTEQERNEDDAWLTWMDISSMIDFNDEVNWILFGNPRDFHNERPKHIPIAKNRGFPKNPGGSLKVDIEWITEYEKKFGKGALFGFSHFYFSEIERIDWKIDYGISLIESDWEKLFDLTAKFKILKRLKPEQIRFSVWYNW